MRGFMGKTSRRSSAAARRASAAREKAASASAFQAKPTTVPDAPKAVPRSTMAPGRTSITFYLPERLRNRARTAFRATRAEETDHSWSDMLTKALIAEVERREEAHNEGKKFIGTDERLKAGRPIGR
jgi:hypothetical protein